MQIHRIDHEPHPYLPPHGQAGKSGDAADSSSITSTPQVTSRHSTVPETTDVQLQGLKDRLQDVPAIRHEAVESAREKVARGDYFTRSAAEQLAATDLRHDYSRVNS